MLSRLIPKEFLESNIRLYSFLFLIAAAILMLIIFPVSEYKGYIDPFYSPTVLVLPLVGLYRLTCYAYRKDYNRHIFKHPLACSAVGRLDDNKRGYTGETSGIFKIENLHRYFLYSAIIILPFFYYDVFVSMFYTGFFVLRLGSLILATNAILISLYVFSCHSFRSLIGGRRNCFNCIKGGKGIKKVYNGQSILNAHHETFAWASLIFIIFTDLYIRGLAAGIPMDHMLLMVLK